MFLIHLFPYDWGSISKGHLFAWVLIIPFSTEIILEERLQILLKDITESFYLNICRGLFEKDKLLYAFLKASSISKRSGDISPEEWNIYLRGSTTDFSGFKNPYDYIN
jgi:hypothetical protein